MMPQLITKLESVTHLLGNHLTAESITGQYNIYSSIFPTVINDRKKTHCSLEIQLQTV